MAEDALERIGRELMFSSFIGAGTWASGSWILERIVGSLEEFPTRAGDVLFQQGDPTEHLYFMNDGRVRLSREGHADWVYEGRWAIGTTDLLAARRRSRTATSEGDARMFRLPGESWLELMEDSFDLTHNALIGTARGAAALYTRLAPDGGFLPLPTPRAAADSSSLVGRALLFSELPLLQDVSVQALTDLASYATDRRLDEGETLFGPAARSDRIHVVVRGSVEVTREEPRVTGQFGPGSVVGGALCLGNVDDAWSARALEPSKLVSFSAEDWFNQMEEHPEMARSAMAALSLERERIQEILALRLGELVLH